MPCICCRVMMTGAMIVDPTIGSPVTNVVNCVFWATNTEKVSCPDGPSAFCVPSAFFSAAKGRNVNAPVVGSRASLPPLLGSLTSV